MKTKTTPRVERGPPGSDSGSEASGCGERSGRDAGGRRRSRGVASAPQTAPAARRTSPAPASDVRDAHGGADDAHGGWMDGGGGPAGHR